MGYRARSVFKLEEMQDRFSLIGSSDKVCDIGAAPGSFVQYIKKILWENWLVVGIDIQPMDNIGGSNVYLLQHDIFEYETLEPRIEEILWEEQKFDIITSDIAPKTTGRKDVDQYASVELNLEILKFSDRFLKKWWNLILKVFKWEDFYELTNAIQKRFVKFKEFKPHACRDRSVELYVICFDKKR